MLVDGSWWYVRAKENPEQGFMNPRLAMSRTLGIIGGLGPESTIDYYRSLIAEHRATRPQDGQPSIIINSIDFKKALGLVTNGRLIALAEYLVDEIKRLAAAGADFGLLSANTPHIVFDDVARNSPIPLISIVEATREEALARGFDRVGLLGTRFTMQSRFYPEVFARSQISVFSPNEEDQAYVHEKYLGELVPGVFKDETREGLIRIISRMKEQHRVQAVILGGTELPLILRGDEAAGVPLLDTTQIHVKAALAQMS